MPYLETKELPGDIRIIVHGDFLQLFPLGGDARSAPLVRIVDLLPVPLKKEDIASIDLRKDSDHLEHFLDGAIDLLRGDMNELCRNGGDQLLRLKTIKEKKKKTTTKTKKKKKKKKKNKKKKTKHKKKKRKKN